MKWRILRLLLLGLIGILSACKSRDKSLETTDDLLLSSPGPSALFERAAANDLTGLRALAKQGVDLHQSGEDGQNALHIAAGEGAGEALAYLIEKGVSLEATDQAGNTPLIVAVRENQLETIQFLLRQGASPDHQNLEGYRPITLAAQLGSQEAVEALALYSRLHLDDALFIAALRGNGAIIDTLTNYGASVYVRLEPDRRTPLMLAAQNGHQEAVRVLLENGANRYSTDEAGYTASQLAKASGHEEIALYLGKIPDEQDFTLGEEGPELLASAVQEALVIGTLRTPTERLQSQSSNSPPAEKKMPTHGPVLSIQGHKLAGSAADPLEDVLQVTSYRESQLPIKVQGVVDQKIAIKYLYGYHNTVQISPGETIPHTNLKVVTVQQKRGHSKSTGGQAADLSEVLVKDTRTGKSQTLTTGLAAHRSAPFAILKNKGNQQYLLAKKGDVFQDAAGKEVEVLEVRPKQVVVLDLETGETRTIHK